MEAPLERQGKGEFNAPKIAAATAKARPLASPEGEDVMQKSKNKL